MSDPVSKELCEEKHKPIERYMEETSVNFQRVFKRFDWMYGLLLLTMLGIIAGITQSRLEGSKPPPDIIIKIDPATFADDS